MKKYWVISSKNKGDFNHTLNTYAHDGWFPEFSTFKVMFHPIDGMTYTILLYRDIPKK